MIAKNGKISAHQITCLLFVDWIAKLMLFLPTVRGNMSGWEFLAAVAAGCLWTLLYVGVLSALAVHVKSSFTAYLRERLGRFPACFTGILLLAFLFINLIYLTRLAGKICIEFLLPEISQATIAVCVLLAGITTAAGDRQKRGRTAEILFFPIAAALAVMIAASAGSVQLDIPLSRDFFYTAEIFAGSGAVFASFSGVTVILYELPHTNWHPKERGRALRRGLLFTAVFLLAAFVTALGVLGEASFSRLAFPVLALMSSARLPGGFLQRWDAVFLAFLLPGLLLSAGTSCYYMKRILGEVLPENRQAHTLTGIFAAALAAIFLTGNYKTAAEIFFKWALCCLTPLVTAIPVFLLILERVKKKCGE